MPPLAAAALRSKLEKSRCYLEYGCGGSSLLAASCSVRNIIFVDTSRSWIRKVESQLSGFPSVNFTGIFINVGDIREWGKPINQSKAINWKNYCYSPWEKASALNLAPDLILIDGRFRVASFACSLLMAKIGTSVLFDDYLNRDHYHVVESLAKPVAMHDRMAEFRRTDSLDERKALFMLLESINNVE